MRRGVLVATIAGVVFAAACANLDGLSGAPAASTEMPNDAAVDARIAAEDTGTPEASAGATEDASTDATVDATIDAGPSALPADVAVNDVATCVVVKGSTVFTVCFGASAPEMAQLLGTDTPPTTGFARPAVVNGSGIATPLTIDQVFGGGSWFLANASLAMSANAQAWAWGANDLSQTGMPGSTPAPPRPLSLSGMGIAFQVASAGPKHGCAVQGTKMLCWGANDRCQTIPNGSCANQVNPAPISDVTSALGALSFTGVAAGSQHTCAAMLNAGNASVVCWGDNTYGQLGAGSSSTTAPVAMSSASAITTLAAGDNHTCTLSASTVNCWGDNRFLQAAPQGSPTSSWPPHTVQGLPPNVGQLYVGPTETCVTTVDGNGTTGQAYCFGAREAATSSTIQMIPGIHSVKKMAVGRAHICAIAVADGDTSGKPALFCWGANTQGQIDPTADRNANYAVPRPVPLPFTAPPK